MRLVILTATLASLALAPAAQAATRYADPAVGSTQPCSADAPCSLKAAVQVAQTGDDVALAPGDYAVTTNLTPRSGVSLHGVAGLPRPRLLGSSQLAGVLLTLDHGATATRLDVEAGSHSEAALSVRQATVSDLVVIGRGANLGLYVQPDRAGTVLTNSVVRCNGCDAGAVVFKGGDNAGNAAAVNVTAIAAGGPAIALSS